MDPTKADFIMQLFPFIAVIVSIAIGGWVLTTWMRINNGYPLDGVWGQAVYPKRNDEAMERIKLLSTENAQLRAELGSLKDRLETIERIVTDEPSRLEREINALSHTPAGKAS